MRKGKGDGGERGWYDEREKGKRMGKGEERDVEWREEGKIFNFF